jgi:hypothetical protein
VVTKDGYILELHRIPHGKGIINSGPPYGKPVLLQHGFGGSSADWLISPTDRNLGTVIFNDIPSNKKAYDNFFFFFINQMPHSISIGGFGI